MKISTLIKRRSAEVNNQLKMTETTSKSKLKKTTTLRKMSQSQGQSIRLIKRKTMILRGALPLWKIILRKIDNS